MRFQKSSKKFKAPDWFQKAHNEAEEKEKELFGYFSEVVGYGAEWCKQNVGKCIEKLESRERNNIIRDLNKIDINNRYIWSRFFYENWNEIKDLVGIKPPEYDSKKKIIKFSALTVSDKFSRQVNKFKNKVRKNLSL